MMIPFVCEYLTISIDEVQKYVIARDAEGPFSQVHEDALSE
jgi:hypothetical protein